MSQSARRPRHSALLVRRRRRTVAVAAAAALVVAGWAVVRRDEPSSAGTGRDGSAAPTPTPTPPATASRPSPSPSATRSGTSRSPSPSPTTVRQRGSGRLVVVPGEVPAPGRGRVTTVRVEVERGIDVPPAQFADVDLATLNDPRSWAHGGTRTFARTDGRADVVVTLASPDTSASLCRPLVTYGKLSCAQGARAVVTSYRWMLGAAEFRDLGVYRRYVVNHEVGHVLGRRHQQCGGKGELAPVMQQQTKQVAPCRPNAWPYP